MQPLIILLSQSSADVEKVLSANNVCVYYQADLALDDVSAQSILLIDEQDQLNTILNTSIGRALIVLNCLNELDAQTQAAIKAQGMLWQVTYQLSLLPQVVEKARRLHNGIELVSPAVPEQKVVTRSATTSVSEPDKPRSTKSVAPEASSQRSFSRYSGRNAAKTGRRWTR